MKIIFAAVVCLFVHLGDTVAQQAGGAKSATRERCPMHDTNSPLKERGEKGMGFSQSATTHHFYWKADGGVIQVEAKDSDDPSSRDEVRTHLRHIAQAFQNGDFDIPLFVHDTVPPGVAEMKRLQKEIRYAFEESANGGRVVIASAENDAVEAIHNFLRFQIKEHKTGDAMEVH
jgi:hypothetical protein